MSYERTKTLNRKNDISKRINSTFFSTIIVCWFFPAFERNQDLVLSKINLWMPGIPFGSNARTIKITKKTTVKKKTQRRSWGALTFLLRQAESLRRKTVPAICQPVRLSPIILISCPGFQKPCAYVRLAAFFDSFFLVQHRVMNKKL